MLNKMLNLALVKVRNIEGSSIYRQAFVENTNRIVKA